MENLLIGLFFIVVIVMALRSSRSQRKNKSVDHSDPLPPPTWQPTQRKYPNPIQNVQMQPFKREIAHTLIEPRVLTGTAFVTDGDTITINKTQIRLFGIDAPELNHPYGQKAKWAMVRLCKGQVVRAEITDEDAYGRTVARCYLADGTDLSAELVKMGLAIDWLKFSGGVYKSLETPDARKKLWLADARQKGRMKVWEKFDDAQNKR